MLRPTKAFTMTDSKAKLDFPDPDYDHLVFQGADSSDCCKSAHDEYPPKKGQIVPEYILGTLVIRIVAARDLEVRVNIWMEIDW